MKKMLAIAVAAALAAPAAVMADTTLYGKAHVSVGSLEDNGGDSVTTVESHSSRIGVKGSTPLDNGLDATYQFEYDVDVDGNGGLKDRNTWVGLKGGFGEVRLGRHDTPYKLANSIEVFADGYADLGGIVNQRRVNNVVAYINKFGPVGFAGAYAGDDAADPINLPGEVRVGNNDRDAFSAAVTYGSPGDGLYVGLGYETIQDVEDDAALSARYTFPAGHNIGAVYEQVSSDIASDEDNYAVNGKLAFGNAYVAAQYGENKPDVGDKTTHASLGGGYKLGKKTETYLLFHDRDVDNATDGDRKAAAIGVIHTF